MVALAPADWSARRCRDQFHHVADLLRGARQRRSAHRSLRLHRAFRDATGLANPAADRRPIARAPRSQPRPPAYWWRPLPMRRGLARSSVISACVSVPAPFSCRRGETFDTMAPTALRELSANRISSARRASLAALFCASWAAASRSARHGLQRTPPPRLPFRRLIPQPSRAATSKLPLASSASPCTSPSSGGNSLAQHQRQQSPRIKPPAQAAPQALGFANRGVGLVFGAAGPIGDRPSWR